MRVALLQLASHGTDREANAATGEAACRKAAEQGAELALFPEMWSIGHQGYDPREQGARERWLDLAIVSGDPFVERFRGLARELELAIGITYLERTPDGPRNTLTLIDARGTDVLTYAKVHLGPWDPPDDTCIPGSGFPVVTLETKGGSIEVGAMICFDREFPESARLLGLAGAEIILTPNACDLVACDVFGDARMVQFRARAFENLAATIMTNYPAPQCDGHSVAVGPDGAVIVRAESGEQIIVVDIDIDQVRELRRVEAGRHQSRRPSLYGPISRMRPDSSVDTSDPGKIPEGHGYIDFVGSEEHFWFVRTLWEAARDLPVREMPLSEIPWVDDGCYNLGDPPTWGAVGDHLRRALEADLGYPIILNVNGEIMDGMHRILKAHALGQSTVPVIQFERTPPPDRVRPLPPPAADER